MAKEQKVKTIKETGEAIADMLRSPNVVFNDVREACTKLEYRIREVPTQLVWGDIPKTKKALEAEVEHLRLRLERAAGIVTAAQVVIRYRAGERAAFRRRREGNAAKPI